MTREEQILNSMVRLFRAFPASGRVDADTVRDYCEAVQRYPSSLVDGVVDDFRLGRVSRNGTFAPSIAELLSRLGQTPMNSAEQAEYQRIATATNARPLSLVKS